MIPVIHDKYRIAENFGGRILWRIDHQQKLVNNILVNVGTRLHCPYNSNDSAVQKEHAWNSKSSLNSVLKMLFLSAKLASRASLTWLVACFVAGLQQMKKSGLFESGSGCCTCNGIFGLP